MVNQFNSTILIVLFTLLSFGISAQNSLPMDDNLYNKFTPQQKIEIKTLLDKTKVNLSFKLRNAKNDEYINRVIMTSSYKFAKDYSTIMENKSVPFKLITSSTSFLGCWATNDYEGTAQCWNQHIQKFNGAEFASLD